MDPNVFTPDRFASPTRVLDIIKDHRGFGFVVAGDKPVFIQSVREGGAAERAGLLKNDVIIKVNGHPVTDSNHSEVVRLIKEAGPFVTLTLIGQNSTGSFNGYTASSPAAMPLSPVGLSPPIQGPDLSKDRLISLPKPVDNEQQRALEVSTMKTLQTMYEREEERRNRLKSQQLAHPNPRTAVELANSEEILKELQRKISGIGGNREWLTSNMSSSQLNSSTRSPPAKRPNSTFGSRRSDMGSHESEEESPPPLPVRITSRMSSNSLASPLLSPGGERRFGSPEVAPPLPPRNNLMMKLHDENPPTQHQRTKSSPFPYRGPEAAPDLRRMSTTESGDLDLLRGPRTISPGPVSPAGSPPPPYSVDQPEGGAKRSHGVTFSAESGMATQWHIPSMEDEDWSDHESSLIEDHGPYSKISTLLEAKAYLAVFVNYLLCNEDPSNLFFLLITDHYKEGTSPKDMCRWAFEINTTFLVPNAPLKVQSVDEQILREIDDVLTNFASKEERLRTVFFKARKRASSAVKVELDDFRKKRQAGLAGLFGPSDEDLKEASGDSAKEVKVVEALLLTKLQEYSRDDLEGSLDDKSLACASALATILSKVFSLKSQAATGLLEKCPTFVTREKSLRTNKLLNKAKKNVSVRGHEFALQNYLSIVECLHCGMILWGVSPQGYQCKNCKINFHKMCLRQFETSGAMEPCVGAPPSKKQAAFKWVPLRKPTIVSNGNVGESTIPLSSDELYQGERSGSAQPSSSSFNGRSDSAKVKRDGSFKDSERPEFPSPSGSQCGEESDQSHGLLPNDSKRQRSGVGRSDSLREPARKTAMAREHRKRSDPNLPPSSGNHEDISGPLAFAHSGSSSNSSLSTRSLESPGPSESRVSNSVQSDSSSNPVPWGDDSDLEADTETPDWTKTVESDVLRRLTAKEKQRQEVINELFHTERSHVRCLKVLDRVFYRPLTEANLVPTELINLLFANLSDMIDIHARFNTLMKQKRKSKGVIDSVGDILLYMFDGQEGDRLQRAASQFCQHQSFALEALKERRKKDTKLDKFLYDAEMNPVCRRLQLKDLLPTGMQRLTKYPLLLESLLKHTPVKNADHQPIKRALERSREVLKAVNAAIHEAENQHRLAELQKRLDKSSLDKSDQELRNFDLTRRRLVHEGPLTWRCKDRRPIDLHVLVLEDSIVLLQKDDNKFVLKYHSVSSTGNSEPVRCSPIIKYTSILLKADARDSTAFYLIDQPTTSPQMYEMVSSSTAERKAWLKHITEATESYMNREGRKRPETTVTLLNLPAQTSSSLLSEQGRTNSEDSNEVPADKSGDSGVDLNIAQEPPTTADNKPEPEQQTSTDSITSQSPEPPKKADDDATTSVCRSGSTVSAVKSPLRRFQRVEILQIAEGTTLIEPTEVKVSQGDVHTAEPVLTPLEKLRRKDQLIRAALVEKQRLVAEVLHVSPEELDQLAQFDSTPLKGANQEAQEARDLVLAAIMQASKLTTVLNESLRITEEEAIAASSEPTNGREPVLVRPLIEHVHPTRECDPVSRHESIHVRETHKPVSPRTLRKIMKLPSLASQRLVPIITTLNSNLTQLMAVVSERDAEREKMRRELQRLREQLSSTSEVEPHDSTDVAQPSLIGQSVEEESDLEEEALVSEKANDTVESVITSAEALQSDMPTRCEPCLERLKSESPPRSRPLSVVSLESVGDGIYVEIRESAYIDRQLSDPKPAEELAGNISNLDNVSADLATESAQTSEQIPSESVPSSDKSASEVEPAKAPECTVVSDSTVAPQASQLDTIVEPDEVSGSNDEPLIPTLTRITESSSSNSSEAPLLIEDFGTALDNPEDLTDTAEAVSDTIVDQISDSLKLQETLTTASEA